MPDKPNLLKMVSEHSDLSRMYEQIASAYRAHDKNASASFREVVSKTHKQTSDVLYQIRMLLHNFVKDEREIDLDHAATNFSKALHLLRMKVDI